MADTKIAKGAALQFAERELGGPLVEVESVVAVGVAQGVLLQGNGDRVFVLFVNLTSGTLNITMGVQSLGTNGISLIALGSAISFNVRDDFTLPSRAFYASQVGGSGSVYIMEMYRTGLTK